MSEQQPAEGADRPRPVIEVTIAAPVGAVWASLRDPALIRRWHGWHYEGLDDEVALIFGTEGADDDAHVLQANAGDRFEVEAVEGGSRVRITRAAFVPGDEWSAYYDDITDGWVSFLNQLRFMHEQHPDAERRTVFLMGRGRPGAIERLLDSVPTAVGELVYSADRSAARGAVARPRARATHRRGEGARAGRDGSADRRCVGHCDQLRTRRGRVRRRLEALGRLVAGRVSGRCARPDLSRK